MLCALVLAAASLAAQQPAPAGFRAVHYEIEAVVQPALRGIRARAQADFQVLEPSRFVEVELHPDLAVGRVTDAQGNELAFDRDLNRPLTVRVTLPAPAPMGQPLRLVFEYSGPLASAEQSPTRGLRLAYVGPDSAWLLLAGRWFPLTNFPGNRYTAVFRINVPETAAVTGTGAALAPEVAAPLPPPRAAEGQPQRHALSNRPAEVAPETAGRVVYTFRVEEPVPAGSFAIGDLRLVPVQAQGLSIPVFAPPAAQPTAVAYGQAVAGMINFFSGEFGPLPRPGLTVVQIPDGTVDAAAAPGVLLISRRRWEESPNQGLLARLVAQQWFGAQVTPATADDVWVTDGLARYAAALYLEDTAGQGALDADLEELAVTALMYEDAAPIARASRLEPYSVEYNSVVLGKGAMVFHMLRSQLGQEAFRALLRDFYTKFAGRAARVEDFRALAEAAAPRTEEGQPQNLAPLFVQWLNSTGVPEFGLEYVVYRTQRGFRIVGKVTQNLETFRMRVGLKIETEGNPELKTIEISGTESNFAVETFGRPKPNGIVLDPANHLLKSSPALRVRTAIARGEALAEGGEFYPAIQHYQNAIELSKNSSLAHFRMGEAMFFQKNHEAAANAFRNALDGDLEPKWIQVWSHIYLGKIFDVAGLRERAVNEYRRALDLNDDTGGARAEAERHIQTPYREATASD